MILLCIFAIVLCSASPVIGGCVLARTDTASRGNSSSPLDSSSLPQGLPHPVVQLAIVGLTVVLAVLLIWCLCQSPFRNRQLCRRPISTRTTIPPLTPEYNHSHSESISASSSTTMNTTSAVEMRAVSPILSTALSKDPGEGDSDVTGHLPIYVELPSVPLQSHVRN